MRNFFSIPPEAAPDKAEFTEPCLRGCGRLLAERIISHGHVTPEGEWYDQDDDEWVLVLEGEATIGYADGRTVRLGRGDSLMLAKHARHRVLKSSSPCVWLAIYAATLRE